MNFKKIKAVTLLELLIYIALSIIVSLILLQVTNLILSKKNTNDAIKENVETIESRKASALLSQYVNKPITGIPPFINQPSTPPYDDGGSKIIYNPWENDLDMPTLLDLLLSTSTYCSCIECKITVTRSTTERGDTFTPGIDPNDPTYGGSFDIHYNPSKVISSDCGHEIGSIFNGFSGMVETGAGICAEGAGLLDLENMLSEEECYEKKIKGISSPECDYLEQARVIHKKTGSFDAICNECPVCYKYIVTEIDFPPTPGKPGKGNDDIIILGEPGVGSDDIIVLGGPNNFIGNYSRFAWSDNVGWVDFSGITLEEGMLDLNGYATVINNNNKISLNCKNTNSCKNSDYKVSIGESGDLHGHAWGGDSLGWISFNCQEGGQNGEDICDTSLYGAYIELTTGEFNGYAWSENIGWISFNCSTGGNNMANICDTSDYKVRAIYLDKGNISMQFEEGSYNIPLQGYLRFDINSISNNTATNDGAFTLTSISGNNFMENALVYLYNKDYGNVYSTNTPTYNSNESISNIQFDLEDKPTGDYSVVFVNPNGDYGILNNAINVTSN